MGSNSTQGLAVLTFLVAFTLLSASLFAGGSLLLFVAFLLVAAAAVGLFLKVKPLEHAAK